MILVIRDWEAAQMYFSAYDKLPPKFSDFIIAHVAGLVAEKTEQNIWEGVNANAGEFDGLVTLALADSDVIDAASHAAVTSANVIAKLGSIVDAIPSTLYNKEDMHLYVSQNIARAYVRALVVLLLVLVQMVQMHMNTMVQCRRTNYLLMV